MKNKNLVQSSYSFDDPDPAHTAACNGDLETVRLFIKKGHSADSTDRLGSTLLHCAAMENQIEIAKYLIEEGASINMVREGNDRVKPGATPLMLATHSASPAMIQLLLDAGADPMMRRPNGESSIDTAKEFYELYPDPFYEYGEKLALLEEYANKRSS